MTAEAEKAGEEGDIDKVRKFILLNHDFVLGKYYSLLYIINGLYTSSIP